jgi:hypothetical protein
MFPQLSLTVILLVSYSMYLPALMAAWGRRYLAIGIATGALLRASLFILALALWAVARYRI